MMAVMPCYLPFFIIDNELKTVVCCCEIIVYQNFVCDDFRVATILGNILLEDMLTKPLIPTRIYKNRRISVPIYGGCLFYTDVLVRKII